MREVDSQDKSCSRPWISLSSKRREVAHDLIDSEVQELCRRWPVILEDNTIVRVSHGRYRINGREVFIRVVLAEGEKEDDDGALTPGCPFGDGTDLVVVRDGPLAQPFVDYVLDTGRSEQYDLPLHEVELSKGNSDFPPDHVEDEYCKTLPYEPDDRVAAMKFARFEDCKLRRDAGHHFVLDVEDAPLQLCNASVVPLAGVTDSMGRCGDGRRRHLFGEVILPGEAVSERFEPDEFSEDTIGTQADTLLCAGLGQRLQISLG